MRFLPDGTRPSEEAMEVCMTTLSVPELGTLAGLVFVSQKVGRQRRPSVTMKT